MVPPRSTVDTSPQAAPPVDQPSRIRRGPAFSFSLSDDRAAVAEGALT